MLARCVPWVAEGKGGEVDGKECEVDGLEHPMDEGAMRVGGAVDAWRVEARGCGGDGLLDVLIEDAEEDDCQATGNRKQGGRGREGV